MTNTGTPAHTSTGIVCGRCSTKGVNAIIKRHANVKDVAACFAAGYAPKVEVPAPITVVPQLDTRVVAAPKAFGRYMAKCTQTGCKQHCTSDTKFRFKCPDHTWVRVWAKQLVGTLSTSPKHKCNDACMYATGPTCTCSCGGANHSIGYLVKL